MTSGAAAIGYSVDQVDNTAGQTADAYNKGQYASANLLYYPVKNVMVGAELLWGEREDKVAPATTTPACSSASKYNFGTTL